MRFLNALLRNHIELSGTRERDLRYLVQHAIAGFARESAATHFGFPSRVPVHVSGDRRRVAEFLKKVGGRDAFEELLEQHNVLGALLKPPS
jgi:hypothetical protein